MQEQPIPGDGNCQFASLSDQLFGTVHYADAIRANVVGWLRRNGDLELVRSSLRGCCLGGSKFLTNLFCSLTEPKCESSFIQAHGMNIAFKWFVRWYYFFHWCNVPGS
jgi:hypothetical protein